MDCDPIVFEHDISHLVRELCAIRTAMPLRVLVLGGSVSEIMGKAIGTAHSLPMGRRVLRAAIDGVPEPVALAVQGCEHINRALVVERWAQEQYGWNLVEVWPVPEAGGSLAAAAMELYHDPVVVETIRAEAGLDIGQTLIGMHLRPVPVPVRLSRVRLGEAIVTAARCRPPLVGGDRARHERPSIGE